MQHQWNGGAASLQPAKESRASSCVHGASSRYGRVTCTPVRSHKGSWARMFGREVLSGRTHSGTDGEGNTQAPEPAEGRMKKEVLKIKAKLLRHFHAWLLTSSLSCTLDFLAYFYQMKLMVAARVALCGYSSGSEQALSACFLCGFPPRSAFPPLKALRNSVLDFCYASVVNAACSDGQGLKPPGSARLAHQPLLCLPLFLSYPCCLWWAKYRSPTPRPGLGFFLF